MEFLGVAEEEVVGPVHLEPHPTPTGMLQEDVKAEPAVLGRRLDLKGQVHRLEKGDDLNVQTGLGFKGA